MMMMMMVMIMMMMMIIIITLKITTTPAGCQQLKVLWIAVHFILCALDLFMTEALKYLRQKVGILKTRYRDSTKGEKIEYEKLAVERLRMWYLVKWDSVYGPCIILTFE